MEPSDKPPAPPGAVPQFISSQQVTAPLPTQPQPPWAYPHYQQATPHVDLKPKQTWHDVVKTALAVVGVLITVGGIIFAAGQLAGEFRTFKAESTKRLDQQETKINQAADSASKANSAALDAATQAREINERLRHLNITGSNHRRSYRDAADRVMPPSP